MGGAVEPFLQCTSDVRCTVMEDAMSSNVLASKLNHLIIHKYLHQKDALQFINSIDNQPRLSFRVVIRDKMNQINLIEILVQTN